jgi:two-component system phosphate regulon sensor histidine kinase PhoR
LSQVSELQSVIQELRIAEEELRAQNEELLAAHAERDEAYRRYRELFDAGPDGLLVTDANGKILEANRAAAELLDVPLSRLRGKVFPVLVAAQSRRALRTALLSLLHGGQRVAESDLRLRRRDGEGFIVHARAVPLPVSAGRLEIRWALRDVTEQRSAAAELRLLNAELAERVAERTQAVEHEQALLAAVVEQNPLGVAILDEHEQVVVVNSEARRMLGEARSPAGLPGYRLDGSSYDGDWPVLRSLRSGEVVIGERARIVRPDTDAVIVEINSGPIRDAAGHTTAAVSIFRDVTHEEQREQAEREFVSNAAHELRTPLAAIVGAVEVLQAGAKDDPAERDRFLAHVERQCRRLERLTTALLTLARFQTQDEPARLEIVELRPLLEDVAQSLHPAARVTVVVDCPPETAVFANRVLLEEAVVNLAMNAMKFTLRGRITLAATETDPGFVALEVRDTGRGMTAADRKRAAERFYRGDDEAPGGFGLGLAIVAAAAEAMGTILEIESTPRRGTTVRLRLRAARVLAA